LATLTFDQEFLGRRRQPRCSGGRKVDLTALDLLALREDQAIRDGFAGSSCSEVTLLLM